MRRPSDGICSKNISIQCLSYVKWLSKTNSCLLDVLIEFQLMKLLKALDTFNQCTEEMYLLSKVLIGYQCYQVCNCACTAVIKKKKNHVFRRGTKFWLEGEWLMTEFSFLGELSLLINSNTGYINTFYIKNLNKWPLFRSTQEWNSWNFERLF